jgi:hypothetical protein
LTRIGVEAGAPGYISATLNVAVRSAPRRFAIPRSPDNPLQDFLNRANQVCSRGVARLQQLVLAHLDQSLTTAQAVHVSQQVAAIYRPVIPQLRAIHAPPQQAGGYVRFVEHLQSALNDVNSVISAAAVGNVSGALTAFAGAKTTLTTADAEASTLELFACS